jgi:hypothetical protein
VTDGERLQEIYAALEILEDADRILVAMGAEIDQIAAGLREALQ